MMDTITMMVGAMTAGPQEWCEAGEMLPLLKRHEVQVLLDAGFAPADVATRAKVSVDSVRRVQREAEVTEVDDAAERKRRRIGRPSKAAGYAEKIRGWLADDVELPTQELFRRAKEAGYDGHKSALYALVAGLRPPRATPIVRFEGLPGEFSQHDFGHVDVRFVDGRKQRVHFFASRLKYSRFVAVTLVEDERVETVVRCLVRDFVSFGGLPLMAVFDRPRTIVKKGGRGRDVEEWNATFAQAVIDIGVGVEMCAPASGNQKGSVERLVGWVKNSFFKPRKFQDQRDLEAQLAAWVLEANTKTPSRATNVIPETRRREELPRLRAVKVFPETLALRIPIFVGPTAEVIHDGVPYTMPPEATHIAGTLFLYEDRVRIVAGRFESEQRRRKKGDPPSPVPEHRAAKIAAVHGDRAKLYEKREQLLKLGKSALALLTEITHREPRMSRRHVEDLYELLEDHGDDQMRAAIERAVAADRTTVAAVRALLTSSERDRERSSAHAARSHTRGPSAGPRPTPTRRAEPKRGAR
jgi:transposase